MRRLIDTHAHVEGISDPASVMHECITLGVDAVLCMGSDLTTSIKALEVSRLYPAFFYAGAGIHPFNVQRADLEHVLEFISLNGENLVVIGEVGLDYSYDFARSKDVRARMREYLERLLEAASDTGLPVSVHSRSAYRDAYDLVASAGVEAVFHWYDGPLHTLHKILDSGLYISASPAIEYSKGVRSVIMETPLEQILIESDSPVFLRNLKRESTPQDVAWVANTLAELKGIDVGEVTRVTSRNAEKLFRI